MTHDSISAIPNIWQLFAHIFLVQDVVDQEALSAGVWYVAIDFQLFACMVVLFWIGGVLQRRDASLRHLAMIAVAGLTAASLLVFNCNALWDETALFYFAYYGLGALVYWASAPDHRRRSLLAFVAISALVAASLFIDFRLRIVVAAVLALLLGAARYTGWLHRLEMPAPLSYLGRISYSIFLVHFPICLLINAAFFRFMSHDPVTSAFGLLLAWLVSVAGGALFYRWVEGRRMSDTGRWGIVATFLATGLVAVWARL
jgi:peptidoglycan/LPS O-acetylase OafA/YrhL